MAHPVFNVDALKKVRGLLRDHRPGQIFNILRFGYHALRGFPATRLPYEPLWLVLFITGRCNLRCIHCPYRSPEGPCRPQLFRDMTLESFRHILDSFPRAIAIVLSGGETLAHPALFEMIHLAHERRLKVHIPTNGTMVANNIEALLQAPVELLNVSLYGTDRESFSRVTGAEGSLFDTIIEGISELARQRSSGGYPRILRASFITGKDNLHRVIDFIRLGEKIGVDQVKLRNLCTYGIPGYAQSMCLHEDDPEVQEFLDGLRRQRFRIPVFLPRLHRRDYRPRRCNLPFRQISIDGDGFIGFCCMEGPDRRWGNFFQEPDAWNSETMNRARRELMDPTCPLPPICLHCEEMIPERPSLGG